MVENKKHITVCICTYKRPQLLLVLLSRLENQITENLFSYSVVIIDNDRKQTARIAVEEYVKQSKVCINYFLEPEQNISLARNKAIKKAEGNFISLIDDDEIPENNWLLTLFKTMKNHEVDGVLGPVIPKYETKPPKWVIKGKIFERSSHKTGDILKWNNTRTGNALLKLSLFNNGSVWFDPKYGSGGEDRDFFKRKILDGCIFIWCQEAHVFETIPPERWKRSTLLKRALLRGKMASKNSQNDIGSIAKSMIAIGIYSVCLPFFIIFGHHLFMKYLIKECDHIGKVFAFFGIDLIKEKYITVKTTNRYL